MGMTEVLTLVLGRQMKAWVSWNSVGRLLGESLQTKLICVVTRCLWVQFSRKLVQVAWWLYIIILMCRGSGGWLVALVLFCCFVVMVVLSCFVLVMDILMLWFVLLMDAWVSW